MVLISPKTEKVEKTESRKKLKFNPAWLWLVAALGGVSVFLVLVSNQPQFRYNYAPEQLAKPPVGVNLGGFYQPQTDDIGNVYVWTQSNAFFIFQNQSLKSVQLDFEIRSAAVANGPDAPVKVLANGVEVGQLRPDPQNPNFQTINLKFVPPPVTKEMKRNELKIELVTTAFKPAQGDKRTLGTMLKRVSFDRSEVWDGMAKRLWMLWSLPGLGLVAVMLFWIAKRYRSKLAGLGAVIASATATIFVMILQITLTGVLANEKEGYEVWQWSGLYLWLVFGLGTVVLFLRQPLLERYYAYLVSEWRMPWAVALLIGLLSFYRLFLTVWVGGPSADETALALAAHQVLDCTPNPEQIVADKDIRDLYQNLLTCGEIPLTGGSAHLGIRYGPYPTYFSMLNYGLVNFNFSGAFLVVNILALIACWLLAATVESGAKRIWVLLLGLTAPVGVNLSVTLGLWNIFWLIPVSAAVLYFGRPAKTGSNKREFLVAIFLGISIGLHPQAAPFVMGIVVWRNFVLRRFSWATAIATVTGMLVPLLPYIIGLLLRLNDFSLKFKAVGFEDRNTDIFTLLTSVYNFSGPQPQPVLNQEQTWLNLEQGFSSINLWVISGLLILTALYIALSYKQLRKLHPMVSCFLCCLFFYLGIGFFTNSVIFWHNNIPTWWFAPLMLPFVLLGLFRERIGSALLILLILFNVTTIVLQYGPKPAKEVSLFTYSRPTYWVQQQTVSDICQIAKQNKEIGNLPLQVYAKSGWLEWYLTSMLLIKQPEDCVKAMRFTQDYEKWDILIEPPTPQFYIYIIRASNKSK